MLSKHFVKSLECIRSITSLSAKRHIIATAKRGSVPVYSKYCRQRDPTTICHRLNHTSCPDPVGVGAGGGGGWWWWWGPKSTWFRSGTMMMIIYALSFKTKNKPDEGVQEGAEDKSTMSDQEKLAAEADKLHNEMKLEDVYKLLVDHKDSDNPELLWRFARACREYGLLPSTSSKVKRSVAYEAVESAKKAVSVDDQSSQCHKWYGISLVESGDYDGVKKKISNSYIIKEHFLKALQLDPTDASCMHLVGRWCFTFADMPWYQQKIASAIFGKPPTSTFEEALEYFDRGEKADPGFYSVNQLYLGKTHIKMKDTQSAITWLTKLKDFPGTKEEDKNAKKEAVDLLKTLGVK